MLALWLFISVACGGIFFAAVRRWVGTAQNILASLFIALLIYDIPIVWGMYQTTGLLIFLCLWFFVYAFLSLLIDEIRQRL